QVLDDDHHHIVPAHAMSDKPASRDDRAALIDARHGCLPAKAGQRFRASSIGQRGLADRYSSPLGKRAKFNTTLASRVVTTVKNRKIEMIDLRFTDLPGLWLGIPVDV